VTLRRDLHEHLTTPRLAAFHIYVAEHAAVQAPSGTAPMLGWMALIGVYFFVAHRPARDDDTRCGA
jgi:hypothetical protein